MDVERPTIIVVDDEPSILEALKRLLSDFEVIAFSNAEEALQHIEFCHGEIDIIVSDFRMPNMDGISFLRQVKVKCPHSLRVLLSGQIDLDHLVLAINEEIIHRFFLKPWDNQILRAQLIEAQQQKKLLDKNNELNHLALTDPVTGLNNHRSFQQELRKQLIEHSQTNSELSLIMIDVDHFKSFNDRYGHPEGDKTLKAISDRIKNHLPENGRIYRYGGEEFALLLFNTSAIHAQTYAEELRKSFENRPFKNTLERPNFITISLGLAQFPLHSTNAQGLVLSADRALYQAKRQGRNQTVVALI